MNHQRACQVLGVPSDASVTTIKLSYHQLVRVWHPDRFADDQPLRERAERQLREINAAYDVCLRGEPDEPTLERETPWYPPPGESVLGRSPGAFPWSQFRPPEPVRPDYNMMGFLLLIVFFTVGAAMIMLAT